MKKFVLKLDLEAEDKEKQRRAFKTVAALPGIDEISIDAKGKKLTVIGTVDPITVVSKLRKRNWEVGIVSVEPAKEPEPKKKEAEAKKDAPEKEEEKKEEVKKEEPKKEEGDQTKKDEPKKVEQPELVMMPYRPYYPPMSTYYIHHSVEENPNACAIC
ncbi:heavy metal-associated isoprenylated plant protein 39 isoform X2 [Andrographis paniculata]|uniref:heavy metal-associated isoprenylated plant protein 39 isoform X2 n=1 Tax=Andrographis paniculata TaxID=175694 RepID=UPI0021E7688B|nr:heavy metal-associated isoprenylated plant protein 39 isoform X2 [Andrographis paniculata]